MNLADRGELVGFLRRHGLLADKGLGQHFLCAPKIVEVIVSGVAEAAGVLEIGPGPGILTGPLKRSHEVIALELDERMLPLLGESAEGARIVHGDALTIDLRSLMATLPEPRAVVSNLPYYITGPLIDRIASTKASWSIAVLMMQREVGDKILAKPGDRHRGALSVRMQAEFKVEKLCNVPSGSFLPPPKVDSVVLRFTPSSCNLEDPFFGFVKQGFAQPRKTLANNLHAAGYPREAIEGAGLEPAIRPHQLSQAEWERLWRQVT